MDFEYGMGLDELLMRTSKQCYKGIKLLTSTSPAVKALSENDLKVLEHLSKAASYFDEITYKLDNCHNMEFLEFLDKQIKKGEKKAELSKRLFLSQKSMFSPDSLGRQTALVSNLKQPDGLGYFPEDLTGDELVKILNQMLDAGETEAVKKILNQRSIVVRDGDKLKAIDFVEAFKEFKNIAKQLRLATEFCDDEKFNEFLIKQAKALEKADENLDAEADKVWATLDENNKFEFTICRECYGENLTKCVQENKPLMQRLKKLNISVYTKDCIGARVGLVNQKGTKLLKKLKGLLGEAAKFMPYKNEYKNKNVSSEDDGQIAVDVDLVALTGDEGAYRAGIVLAQNLPNDDKLSVQTGGGRRNVYHRQIRTNFNKKLFKNLITESQFHLFNPHASHLATICHENTHSLGPVGGNKLGEYSSILEEYKADTGMYAFLDEFEKAGYFSKRDTEEIIVTELSCSFGKGKPSLSEAHRTRSVMIVNRMLKEKAITFDKTGKLQFDFAKVKATAKTMLAEVIRLQLDAEVSKAKAYVERWFEWTDEIENVAEIIKKYSKKLNGYLIMPLYDELIAR